MNVYVLLILACLSGDLRPVANLELRGDGTLTLNQPVVVTGSLIVEGVTFRDCDTAITLMGDVKKVELRRVGFRNCRIGLKAIRVDGTIVHKATVERCTWENTTVYDDACQGLVFDATANFDITVRNCTFRNLRSKGHVCAGIYVGHRDTWAERITITGNTLERIYDVDGTEASCGVICVGQNVLMANNIFRDGNWTNAYYLQGANSIIRGNVSIDAGGGGVSIKSHAQYEPKTNRVLRNVILGRANHRAGIRVVGNGVVADNIVRVSIEEDASPLGGWSFENKTSDPKWAGGLSIHRNVLQGPRGVWINAATSLRMANNSISSDSSGLGIFALKGVEYGRCVITGNGIRARTKHLEVSVPYDRKAVSGNVLEAAQ